jgi:hypothetical protein
VDTETKVSFKVLKYRYIDLRKKAWYDYRTFSDTAKIIKQGPLPDSVFTDDGWAFYSAKALQIEGSPQSLSDTIIEGVNYHRAKFHLIRQDPRRNFEIGYLIADKNKSMFSLEMPYSKSINCVMTKIYSFNSSKSWPYVLTELLQRSNSLTDQEIGVFKAWENNDK